MNRRAFFGAFAALLTLPAAAVASRSLPSFEFRPHVSHGFMVVPPSPRLYYTPWGELDWIEMPRNIVDLKRVDDSRIWIECVGGNYEFVHHGTPARDWFVREVR